MDDIRKMMYRIFQTEPQGIKIFEYLTSRFYDIPLFNKDPYINAYNAGQHDLILQIINMMATTQRDENEE